MNAALRMAWLVAALSALLASASLAGDGTGLFGIAALSHPIWSYAFLLVAAAAILATTPRRRSPKEGEA